jgi:hypothetical protein
MDASCGFSVRLDRFQLQNDVDSADHKNVVFQLNFADRFRHQSLIGCVYLTRLQRASEGPRKSTRSSSHHIVQGGRMWFQNRRRNLVVLRNCSVHSEYDRLIFRREVCSAHRSLDALDANIGPVNDC